MKVNNAAALEETNSFVYDLNYLSSLGNLESINLCLMPKKKQIFYNPFDLYILPLSQDDLAIPIH